MHFYLWLAFNYASLRRNYYGLGMQYGDVSFLEFARVSFNRSQEQ